MPSRPARTLLSLAVLLALSACNGDDDPVVEPPATTAPTSSSTASSVVVTVPTTVEGAAVEPYVEALAGSFQLPGISEDTARCMSEAVVGVVGPQLVDLGVNPEAFALATTLPELGLVVDEDAEAELTESLDACDLGAFLASSVAAEIPIDPRLSDLDCIHADVNDDPTVASVLAASLAGDTAGPEALQGARIDALVSCEPLVLALAVAAFEEGGDPSNEELESCFADGISALTPDELATFLSSDITGGTLAAELTDGCAGLLGG
ncbi:MAG: hypothetical protein H0W25_02180 [Acidimicrobiia bacterium]|nr:hypothetical protein [Acidimicrobiia bacterium]